MKKILLLLVLPAMLYCNGKPRIQFDLLSFDFGRQDRNVVLKHIFTFKNTGDAVLTINSIKPT